MHSPVPVVVVRPNDEREAMKTSRKEDASRQTYAHLLARNPMGNHESEFDGAYPLQPSLSSKEEMGNVARAIGLPTAFDPALPLTVSDAGGWSEVETDESEEDGEEFDPGLSKESGRRRDQRKLHSMATGEAAALMKGFWNFEHLESEDYDTLEGMNPHLNT